MLIDDSNLNDSSDVKSKFTDKGEELIFSFEGKNVDLKLLNEKIVELLKISWINVDSRYNKKLQSYAITPVSKPLRNGIFDEEPLWVMVFIDGHANNFKIKFYFQEKIPINEIKDGHLLNILGQIRKSKLKIELLRKIEEICHSLTNTRSSQL